MKAEHLSQIQAAVAAVKERKTIRRFYFVACGGSQASMMPIQYMFDRETSIPSAIYTSNEFVKATPKVLDDTCVVLTISHSGNTPETVRAAELAKEKGAVSISLTNLVDSPLWKACEYPIHYEHGPEADPNDLSKVILYTLAFEMLNVVEPSEKWTKGAESLKNLPEVTERIKAKYADFGLQWGKDYKRETVIYTMGSGANYGEMYSLAICLFMEMQWIHSNCIHSGEYFHGPFEVTDFDVPFVLVKGIGATRELDERAYNFCSKFSQKLAVIDEAEFDLTGIEPGVQEYVAPLLAGTVVREMIDSLAHERGHALSVRRYMWQMEY
jgi:fructoselysine 6-phosphate deglycase